MTYSIEGIILSSREIKEVDRIYSVFSRQKGRQRFVGIGTRRLKAKLASGLEPMTKSEIFLVKGRGLDKTKGVLILNQYSCLKKDFDLIMGAQKTFKIIEDLTLENEPDEEFYDDLKFFLKTLNVCAGAGDQNERLKASLVQLGLIWRLIQKSGQQPNFFGCFLCKKKLEEREKYRLSIPGGISCEKCSPEKDALSLMISKNTVKLLRMLLAKNIQIVAKIKTTQKEIRELERVTRMMLEDILGRRVIL